MKKNKINLYRKMSIEELNDIFENGFRIVAGNRNDYLKWFSESLITAVRFKNPYFNTEEIILRTGVNEEFLNYIRLNRTKFDENLKHTFYKNPKYVGAVIECPAHIEIDAYRSYGLDPEALTKLNNNIIDYEMINPYDFSNYLLKDFFDVDNVEELIEPIEQLDKNSFYIELPYDIAMVLKKYNKIITEGLNQKINSRKVSRNLKELIDKGNNLPCIVEVKLINDNDSHNFLRSLSDDKIKEIDKYDIEKLNKIIENVKLIKVFDEKGNYQTASRRLGNNKYKIHTRMPFNLDEIATIKDSEKLNELLEEDLTIDKLINIFPWFKNLVGCNQIEPKHIYDVASHTLVSLSNLDKILKALDIEKDLDVKDILNMKLALIFHDAGKPFCDNKDITSRYQQFKHHYENYGINIAHKSLENYKNQKLVESLAKISSLNGGKTQRAFFEKISKNITSLEEIKKIVMMTFIIKCANNSSMQVEKFAKSYQENLNLLNNFNTYLKKKKIINYDIFTKEEIEKLVTLEDVVSNKLFPKDEIKNKDIPILSNILDLIVKENNYTQDYTLKNDNYKNLSVYKQLDLKDCLDIINDSNNKDLLTTSINNVKLETFSQNTSYGIHHSERVAFFTFVLGELEEIIKEDMEILMDCAIYHDWKRKSDNDVDHGIVGAIKFKERFKDKLNEERIKKSQFLIEGHTKDEKDFDELLKKYSVPEEESENYLTLLRILKDADTLDRVRIEINSNNSPLDINRLTNNKSRHLIKASHQLNELYQIRKRELTNKKIINNTKDDKFKIYKKESN